MRNEDIFSEGLSLQKPLYMQTLVPWVYTVILLYIYRKIRWLDYLGCCYVLLFSSAEQIGDTAEFVTRLYQVQMGNCPTAKKVRNLIWDRCAHGAVRHTWMKFVTSQMLWNSYEIEHIAEYLMKRVAIVTVVNLTVLVFSFFLFSNHRNFEFQRQNSISIYQKWTIFSKEMKQNKTKKYSSLFAL